MFRNILQSIEGIELYPIISLTLFFAMFAAVIVWYFRADKRYLDTMAQMPLEQQSEATTN